jgi:hypothetical protein
MRYSAGLGGLAPEIATCRKWKKIFDHEIGPQWRKLAARGAADP